MFLRAVLVAAVVGRVGAFSASTVLTANRQGRSVSQSCIALGGLVLCSKDETLGDGYCPTTDYDPIRTALAQGISVTEAVRKMSPMPVFPAVRSPWKTPDFPGVQVLEPGRLFLIENFATPQEVDALVKYSRSRDPQSNGVSMGPVKYCEFRKSGQWEMQLSVLSDLAPDLPLRIVQVADAPPLFFETLAMTRYDVGEFYSDHNDEEVCDRQLRGVEVEATNEEPQTCKEAGRRATTVLVYLTDSPDDGATYFPRLDKRVFPKRGRAILFHPTTPEGLSDPLMVHAAEESRAGGKMVLQQWVIHGR